MLTLDEAINHCEEKAIKLGFEAATSGDIDCLEYAKEYKQLAEWLKELKAYKEAPQGDTISRSALLKAFAESNHIKETASGLDVMEMLAIKEIIDNATTIEPDEVYMTGEDYNLYMEGYKSGLSDGRKDAERPKGEWIVREGEPMNYECPFCGELNCCKGNFCPDCGADLRGKKNE